MGHSSINVTLDRYGHLFPELDGGIAETFGTPSARPPTDEHRSSCRRRSREPSSSRARSLRLWPSMVTPWQFGRLPGIECWERAPGGPRCGC
jgi:hypothetical protein